MIHFIVPIRHPDTVRDPAHQMVCLRQLFTPFDNQTSKRRRAIVVTNEGQVLPDRPDNLVVQTVELPATHHESGSISKTEMYEAIRADKGARIAAAMSHIGPDDQVMIVDDDDLIHRDLVHFVDQHPPDRFWYVAEGYFWENGSNRLGKMDDIFQNCGSSLIVPRNCYAMFEEPHLGRDYVIKELGSHRLIFDRKPIGSGIWSAIPFRAVIYRVQHSNASLTRFARDTRTGMRAGPFLSRARALARGVRKGLRGDPRGGVGVWPLTAKIRNAFFGKD